MKKQIVSLMAIWGLAVAVSPAFAQSKQGMRATVPFDFVVAGRTLPAGEYIVEPSDNYLRIQNLSGTARIVQLTNSTEKPSVSGKPEMVFLRYGDTSILSRVKFSATRIGHQLPKTKLEKELAAKLPPTEISTSLAASTR